MSAVVVIIGEGQLADFVSGELSAGYRIVRQADFEAALPAAADVALVLHDAWHPAMHLKAEEAFRASGIPWLRGFVSFGEGVVGPLVKPGMPGCSQCADLRRLMAGSDRAEMLQLRVRLAADGGTTRDGWASHTGLLQMTHLIVKEVQMVVENGRSQTEEHVILTDLKTLESSRHFFQPDPLCQVCSQLPDDSPIGARIKLVPNPKPSADSYRCRSMHDLKKVLSKDYFDYRTGLLNGKRADFLSPFADSSVNLPLIVGDEATAGRSHSYADSELTAILEGLERYSGLKPRGKRTVIHDSYCHLENQALNPIKVGVHAQEQYARPDFPYQPFDPERDIDWVWGYSFRQERPILVPEQLAYYSLGGGQGFVYETSNGCALGGSLEEAIFYGIMEVAERDSFLMTWYAKLPVPRLDPASIEDLELQLMMERLQMLTGYELHLFNSTMENGIPGIWALAKNRKRTGMNLVCAAGAHPDPVRAVKSAVHELAGMLLTMDSKFEATRGEYRRMLRDPFQVTQMDDHSMLYGLPEAEERLHFLLDENRPSRMFGDEFKRGTGHADLTEDLKELVHTFHRLNLDVIVVDQTTPEIRRNGLYCVKVLIPGMLPMTFGHHLTRVTGLERLLRVPMELGYAKRRLTEGELNPYPHPFP